MAACSDRHLWLPGLIAVLFGSLAAPATAGDETFRLSPPASRPSERWRILQTDLRGLVDARGLALLVEDEAAASRLDRLVKQSQKDFAKLLAEDPELLRIDDRTAKLFEEMLGARAVPARLLASQAAAIPRERVLPVLTAWLKSIFQRRDVAFPVDLERLSKEDAADICLQARAIHNRRDLPAWRYRVLLWRYRDSEVKRLFAERDARMAFLTPIRLPLDDLDVRTRLAAQRYLAMLRNLKLQVAHNEQQPYEVFRTLDGLLRGLRYMDTIREAADATGLDHRLMTRLFIQESEFIHHRVSSAGAFSLAQFLNIAVKDVWLFRHRIPGSTRLLAGIGSWQELRKKILDDPRMAIRAACLFFRRLRDDITRRLGSEGKRVDGRLADLLTVELFSMQSDLQERSRIEVLDRTAEAFSEAGRVPEPVLPGPGSLMPDPAAILQRWMDSTVRELVELSISEQVVRGRLKRLEQALAISAYNAGVGNLLKAARQSKPYQSLSFPLLITENRGYIDGILDGMQILRRVDQLASGIERMSYADLMRLAEKACQRAGVDRARGARSPGPGRK
ncbi:MAG: hypothetical protein JXR96_03485 [Deltaproteobacteria bacterium]|nr:hypothetical protein [Deltaproteobacteria bacterium]